MNGLTAMTPKAAGAPKASIYPVNRVVIAGDGRSLRPRGAASGRGTWNGVGDGWMHSAACERGCWKVVCAAGTQDVEEKMETGDGGDDGGRPRDFKSTDEKDEGDDGEAALLDALIKVGATMRDLPKDMQVALKAAAMTVEDIHHFLALSAIPVIGNLCRTFPGMRERLMGNPRFLLQIFLEIALGVSAKSVAEYKARGERFFKEMPFVLSDLALEVLGNFCLVWLLSPRRVFKQSTASGLASFASKLPGHCLQKGSFTIQQRAMAIALRGSQFFCVGFGTSMVGHSLTKYAVEQGAADAQDEAVELAPVLENSLAWGSFMALSSNLRYQTVNCLEERVLDAFIPNKLINVSLTTGLRFTNCFLGGVQWVWFVQKLGLQ